jgi:hypothetical protein
MTIKQSELKDLTPCDLCPIMADYNCRNCKSLKNYNANPTSWQEEIKQEAIENGDFEDDIINETED